MTLSRSAAPRRAPAGEIRAQSPMNGDWWCAGRSIFRALRTAPARAARKRKLAAERLARADAAGPGSGAAIELERVCMVVSGVVRGSERPAAGAAAERVGVAAAQLAPAGNLAFGGASARVHEGEHEAADKPAPFRGVRLVASRRGREEAGEDEGFERHWRSP